MTFATAVLLTFTLFSEISLYAEEHKINHRIVMEISGDGDERWNGMLTNVKNLRSALGNEKTHIEVVV